MDSGEDDTFLSKTIFLFIFLFCSSQNVSSVGFTFQSLGLLSEFAYMRNKEMSLLSKQKNCLFHYYLSPIINPWWLYRPPLIFIILLERYILQAIIFLGINLLQEWAHPYLIGPQKSSEMRQLCQLVALVSHQCLPLQSEKYLKIFICGLCFLSLYTTSLN